MAIFSYNNAGNLVSIKFESESSSIQNAKDLLNLELAKFRADSIYAQFKAANLVIYKYVWGWTTGYAALFLTEEVEIKERYSDEVTCKRKQIQIN